MNIIKHQYPSFIAWPVFSPLARLNDELDQLFEQPNAPISQNTWLPSLDVLEDKNNYIVLAELPGLKREEIKVSLEDGTLTISGERKVEAYSNETSAHRIERLSGRFKRSIGLPATISTDMVKAAYADGVLTVTLPKSEQAKPKKIDVMLN